MGGQTGHVSEWKGSSPNKNATDQVGFQRGKQNATNEMENIHGRVIVIGWAWDEAEPLPEILTLRVLAAFVHGVQRTLRW